MRLAPIEEDRLLVFLAAELARRRLTKGLRLTYPEAVALITDEMHEAARAGVGYEGVVAAARGVLRQDQVLDGVPALVSAVRVECMFDDGMRLVVVSSPIALDRNAGDEVGAIAPGRRLLSDAAIDLNVGREPVSVAVTNASDDVIWVGSHYPFFEVNRRLVFDRSLAWGRHLDIPAGDAMRFGARGTVTVSLIHFGGQRISRGFNGLTDGAATEARLPAAMKRAEVAGFVSGRPK